MDSDTERVHRIMGAASRPKPVREPEEVFLVDHVQQRGHRPLDDFVLQGCNRERTLPAVWFGYVDSPARQCPIRSTLDTVMRIPKIALKVCFVVRPSQLIYARRCVLLDLGERRPEQFDVNVMEERGESLVPSLGW